MGPYYVHTGMNFVPGGSSVPDQHQASQVLLAAINGGNLQDLARLGGHQSASMLAGITEMVTHNPLPDHQDPLRLQQSLQAAAAAAAAASANVNVSSLPNVIDLPRSSRTGIRRPTDQENVVMADILPSAFSGPTGQTMSVTYRTRMRFRRLEVMLERDGKRWSSYSQENGLSQSLISKNRDKSLYVLTLL